MSNHKKIDWLRWHKRKSWIRMNCAIIMAILLIVLLCMFPIVSDAQGSGEVITVSGIEDKPFYIPTNYCMGGSAYSDWRTSQLDSNSTWSNNSVYGSSISLDCTQYFTGSGLSYPNDDYKYYVITTDGNYVWTNYIRSNYQCFWFNNRVQVAHSPEYEAEKYAYWYAGTISNPNSNSFVSQNNDINASGIYCLATNMMVISAKSGITISQMQSNFGSLLDSGDIVNVNWNYLPNYDPFSTEYGKPVDTSSTDILNNDYVGENNFIYCNGSSLNNFEIIIGLDFNSSQNPSDYKYTLDVGLAVDCNIANNAGRNAEKSLLNSYGINPSGATWNIKFDKTFSNTITDNLSSNVFTIPSTVFNDGLVDSSGYTAVPFCNYVSNYVPRGSLTNELEAFKDHLTGTTLGPFSMPGYTETNYFSDPDVVYNFSLNLYDKNDKLITNVPLATNYNAITGSQTQYSNGGGKSQSQVQNTINEHNQNKTPTDPDYKNPDDYKPSITKDNNDSSSNSNSNSSSSSNPITTSNASVTINQPSTYPTTPIMNKFISIIHNEKQGSVDKVESIIESNGYIELCNQALSAVPQPIWDAWTLAIKAILGILVSAFFLKILVNWAT